MLVVGVRQRVMPLLGTRQGFVATSLIMTVLGSATTIVAPIVLKPADFAQFALLSAMFMYTTDFDLGLSRLADRVLHSAHFPYTFSDLVVARLTLCVGVSALMFVIGCCFGGAMATAGLAGVMFMAANGPLSY